MDFFPFWTVGGVDVGGVAYPGDHPGLGSEGGAEGLEGWEGYGKTAVEEPSVAVEDGKRNCFCNSAIC